MESRRCGLGFIYVLETIQLAPQEFTDLQLVLKVTTVKVFFEVSVLLFGFYISGLTLTVE